MLAFQVEESKKERMRLHKLADGIEADFFCITLKF
jgi:hypothetical protein